MLEATDTAVVNRADQLWSVRTRRAFLRVIKAGGIVVLLPSLFEGCDDDTTGPNFGNAPGTVALDLRTDRGILNFLFLFEQTEVAFYNAAVTSPAFAGMTAEQREVISDIRAVETVHREFLRSLLGSTGVGNAAFNQSTINSAAATAASILRTSEMLEDTGTAAQIGIAKYINSATNLTIAGKINSVEARHVAAIRDLREAAGIPAVGAAGTRFAGDDIVVSTGSYAGLNAKVEFGEARQRVIATGFLATTLAEPIPPLARTGTPDFPPPNPTP